MSNVILFTAASKKAEPLAYAPGVVPFDRSNPVHVRAWNTLFALGWSELKAEERGL
jgi:hypothetical protein